ncbi:MAG: hypothetical protein AB2693_01220 [Candidatus Thiodiazotropha sp.]
MNDNSGYIKQFPKTGKGRESGRIYEREKKSKSPLPPTPTTASSIAPTPFPKRFGMLVG